MSGTLLTEIIKLTWPFVKENVLEGGTLGDWLKRNWMTLAWMFTTSLMLFTVINLFGHILTQRQTIGSLQSTNYDLTQTNVSLGLTVDALEVQVTGLQEEVEVLTLKLSTSEEKADLYADWLDHCGVDVNNVGRGMPRCPVRQTVRRKSPPAIQPPEPQPAVQPRKFRERLRELFKPTDQ